MALDLTRMQILAKPVSSYYEGRALRNAEAMAQKQGELLDANIERAKLEVDGLKNPAPDLEKRAKIIKAAMEIGREHEVQLYSEYKSRVDAGEPEESVLFDVNKKYHARQLDMAEKFPGFYTPDLDADYDPKIGLSKIIKADDLLKQISPKDDKQTSSVQEYEYAVKQGYKGSFMDFEKDMRGKGISMTMPDGTVVEIGGSGGKIGPGELTKPTINNLQETIVRSTDRLDRLNLALTQYNPEFLRMKGLGKAWTTRFRDFAGLDVSSEDMAFLKQYAEFQTQVKNDLSRFLNELSGAAISPQELERLKKSAPSGDELSPAEFEAKARATIKNTTRAIMRANWALKNGIGVRSAEELSKAMPLDSIDTVYEQRANEIWQQIGGDPSLKAEAIKRANQEFGLAR